MRASKRACACECVRASVRACVSACMYGPRETSVFEHDALFGGGGMVVGRLDGSDVGVCVGVWVGIAVGV